MDYIAYLHKDRKSDFGVSFPDFPGCITAGRTLEEARRKAAEALSFHIAGMVEDGEKIPRPSTVGQRKRRNTRTKKVSPNPPRENKTRSFERRGPKAVGTLFLQTIPV